MGKWKGQTPGGRLRAKRGLRSGSGWGGTLGKSPDGMKHKAMANGGTPEHHSKPNEKPHPRPQVGLRKGVPN